jgi:anthranilate phosphoribosyltransferase
MTVSILEKVAAGFGRGNELGSDIAEEVLDALISETDESAIAELLIAWNAKGIEEHEIYEFARILRSRMKRVNSRHETFIDIVGTGGSKAKTFNVSTAAAFVVAGAGVPVAKHGNKATRSASALCSLRTITGFPRRSRRFVAALDSRRSSTASGRCAIRRPPRTS